MGDEAHAESRRDGTLAPTRQASREDQPDDDGHQDQGAVELDLHRAEEERTLRPERPDQRIAECEDEPLTGERCRLRLDLERDAFVYGHIDAEDEVLGAFFSKASPEVRGDALGKVAWSFFHASSVEESIRDRFAALWDDRIDHVRANPGDSEELEGIYWLAKSSSFTSEWWLPRLRDALELEPTIATERYMIGKELAQASTKDPATALALLKLLLGGRGEGGLVTFDLTRHAIPVVIANAMLSSDGDLKDQADAYMNELGAQGNLALEDQVQAVLDGKVSVDDVDE